MAMEGVLPSQQVYCPTRDIGQARVEKIVAEMMRNDWRGDEAGLLAAVIGELVGNCFDHNLGNWRDIPGCWLETAIEGNALRAIVADRGQGVFATLRHALPDLRDAKEALLVAFTKNLSGRAPEKRGNGLKFVLRSLGLLRLNSFIFISGNAKLVISDRVNVPDIPSQIFEAEPAIGGTYLELIVARSL